MGVVAAPSPRSVDSHYSVRVEVEVQVQVQKNQISCDLFLLHVLHDRTCITARTACTVVGVNEEQRVVPKVELFQAPHHRANHGVELANEHLLNNGIG